MTPECPKDPEREARPEELASLKNRVESAIVWARHDYDHNENLVISREAAANAAWSEVGPELERLTAEVEQQRVTLRGWYDYSQRTLLKKREWRQRVSSAEAEVSRLREQLAAQPQNLEAQLTQALANAYDYGSKGFAFFADEWARDTMKYWGVSPAEAEAPQHSIVHSVLLSSDTGVMGVWQAFCSGCRQRSVGDLAHAEFWKDQHLADVLVPTLTNESFISPQQAADELSRETQEVFEGRPSGSTATPRSEPTFSVDEMMASGWETAVAQGERDLLLKMAGELLEQCTDWDDQYGVCAVSVPDPACRIRAIVNRYAMPQDAAQAARSEATPEVLSSHAKVMADQYREFADLIERIMPSPSLRKEGEDSDPDV